MQNRWFKNGIYYSLDVETFFDSDGDGIGDFQGLISKLDHIAGLGFTCIWLLPFYPSPNRDNGYDVIDYYNVDERLGTLGDFSEFMDKATELGIRIIIDLVVNHTSIQHPWFQEARKDKNSKYRDFYVWADEPLAYEKEHLMFTGEEDTIWTYDEAAGQYYLHRFYKEQPDLNISNDHVREEILKIIGYWLSLGVSGFRVDAAEMLIEPYGLMNRDKEDLSWFFKEMRDFIISKNSDAILLAEANVLPEKMATFIEGDDRMHMLFNFYVNQYFFLSLAKEDASPLIHALHSLPPLHHTNQWLNFLRHHDELNLKLLTDEERQIVFQVFGPGENMRIYGKGVRRRLAPMLDGERKKLELCYSFLFSLPGVPLIRYGDEIGMGEDLTLEGRNSVRTPMQWSDSKNGGFSTASEKDLVHPVIQNGAYAYQNISVRKAQDSPASLLNWMERLIRIRKQCPEIGVGQMKIIKIPRPEVLILDYQLKESRCILLHNFSGHEVSIHPLLEEETANDTFIDVLNDEPIRINEIVVLKEYEYKWIRQSSRASI